MYQGNRADGSYLTAGQERAGHVGWFVERFTHTHLIPVLRVDSLLAFLNGDEQPTTLMPHWDLVLAGGLSWCDLYCLGASDGLATPSIGPFTRR